MAVGQVQPAQVQYEIVFKVRGQLNFQTPPSYGKSDGWLTGA